MKTFILIMFCLLIGFLAGKSKSQSDYYQGFSDGTDSTISITRNSTQELRSVYSRSKERYLVNAAKIDSIIAEYEASQVESYPNHSELK